MERVKRDGSLPRQVKASAEKVWPIASDFAGIKKVLVEISSCQIVEGIPNKVGCVRKIVDGHNWAYEKLESMDHETMTYCYSIATNADNNFGFVTYLDEVSVRKIDDGMCTVTWTYSFEAPNDKIADWLVSLLSRKSATMASKMEELVQ